MRALVIVPTFNERDNLPLLARDLLAIPDLRILVVDDGSPDGTAEVAERLAAQEPARVLVLRRSGPRGIGRSYVAGMRFALQQTHAEVICQMDADLSHSAADLVRLLGAARDADLVLGSRYVAGGRVVNWPARRLILSTCANQYVRLITRVGVRDVTSGFRCWRRLLLQRLRLDTLRSEGYAFQVEMTWLALRAGARIAEVPITFVERRQGRSKMSSRVIAESVVLPWRLVLGAWHD